MKDKDKTIWAERPNNQWFLFNNEISEKLKMCLKYCGRKFLINSKMEEDHHKIRIKYLCQYGVQIKVAYNARKYSNIANQTRAIGH